MSAALATLNGQIVTACRVTLPAYGRWWAEVECGESTVLTGAATLVLDDATFVGTILTAGTHDTRTRYRIVAGAGGWGKKVADQSYANDADVKVSTVVTDAARACGETVGPIAAALKVGPSFLRRSDEPAARVLDVVAPRAWYVDEAGVTQIGRRAAVAFAGGYVKLTDDIAQGRVEIAPATLVGLVPGAIVEGVEAVDVDIELDGGKLRTTVWGKGITDASRLPDVLRSIVEAFTAEHRFYAPWEYRVIQQVGDRLDLQIVRVSSGMPDLPRVPMVPGLLGERVTFTLGATCVVSFLNGDRTRPRVTGGDYMTAPSLSKLAGGGPKAARVGDTVKAWLVLAGATPTPPAVAGQTIASVKTEALALALIAAMNLASLGSAAAAPVESTSWVYEGSDHVEIG